MSYIRSLSNPEGLYIWGFSDGGVTIAAGPDVIFDVDAGDFNRLIRNFAKYPFYPKRSGTLRLTETKDFKVRLTSNRNGKRHSIVMWEATWVYIVHYNSHRAA